MEENNSEIQESAEEPEEESVPSADSLEKFQALLIKGSIKDAVDLFHEERFTKAEYLPIVKSAFNKHKKENNFRHAIKIAEEFTDIDEETRPLCLEELKQLTRAGDFKEAALWAKEQNLSDTETGQSAKMAYIKFIQQGKIDEAFRVLDEFELDKQELLNETIVEFNHAYEAKKYYEAAIIGDKFNFSRVRTLTAAVQATVAAIEKENYQKAIKVIYEFYLTSDNSISLLHEKEAKEFFAYLSDNFIEALFAKGNLKLLQEFTDKTDFLIKPADNDLVKNFFQKFLTVAVNTHNKNLNNDDLKSSQFIVEAFHLFDLPLSTELRNSLIETAEKYHHSLLKAGELDNAIAFKNKYELFSKNILKDSMDNSWKEAALFTVKILEKGDLRSARIAKDAYKIPEYLVNDSIYAAISNLMRECKYKEVFKIQREMKLDRSKKKIHEGLMNMFHDIMNQRDYEIAAEFGELFSLNRSFIEDAAFKAWLTEFRNKKYDEAMELKKRYKISKKKMVPAATQAYWKFMETKEYDMASHIRKRYGVHLSFGQLIMEFIRRILGR